jgi:ABC-type uncharacterized transport system substrate-binding protein
MTRRNFLLLAVLSGVARWPLTARAQQRTMPTIGFLSSGSPRAFAELVAAFREGLGDQGYNVGSNVWIDYRWAEGYYNDLDTLAAELVRNQVALIAATGGVPSARAGLNATRTIPVVFIVGVDPIQLGLVASLNKPGGNATGASIFTTELAMKRLELLSSLVPGKGAFALLVNPKSAGTDIETKMTATAAESSGRSISILNASTESEIDDAFNSAADQHVGALLISADPLFMNRRAQLVALAARHAIPAMFPLRQYVVAGGLMSYGPELTWAYRRIGQYAGRILKGTKPSDLPVEQPTEFKLVINLATAKALGLAIPPRLLALSDEVIE